MVHGLTIIEPIPPALLTTSNGSGGQNMLSHPPKEVWAAAATGTTDIDLDFGTAAAIDSFFLGFANAAATATWAIFSKTGPAAEGVTPIGGGAVPFRVAEAPGPRHHAFMQLPQAVSSRYFRISVTQPATADPLFIGRLIAGNAFEKPYEYKSGRRPVDLSRRTDLFDGGFGVEAAAIKSSFRLTLADLEDGDVDELYEIIMRVGEHRPILLIEGYAEAPAFRQIHHCLFDKFEPYERNDPQDTRWGLGITDWI